ncbi:transposase [Falsibacillus pallidus]|uniref:Transposase n=1 Tax=Falsibacillus pallidus TaxID=493781 RepID=A0A370FXB5_9BACI|nr:transposase [Falsibacillus pallidus]RDI36212.1 transposase [Falsibacillus pallidus]
MAKDQKKFPAEFREYVCKLIELDGRKLVDVSKELNISYSTLQKWLGSYRKKRNQAEKEKQSQYLTASEYKELYEAERQKKLDLEEENAILKKAMHIFTQEKK